MRKVLSVLLSCIMLISMIGVLPARQVSAESGSDEVRFVSVGRSNAVITTGGSLYCWGEYNGINDEASTDHTIPENVLEDVSSVGFFYNDYSAIAGGDLYCWTTSYTTTYNYGIQTTPISQEMIENLEEGEKLSDIDITKPYLVMSNVMQVYSAGGNLVVVDNSGDMYFTKSQKISDYEITSVPKDWYMLEKVLSNVAYISDGTAITTNGDLYCWGNNVYGIVGNGESGSSANVDLPVKIMSNVAQVSTGGGIRGAITTNGDLYCWGSNSGGGVGNGINNGGCTTTPVKILSNVKQMCFDTNVKTAITEDGELYGWGELACLGMRTSTQYTTTPTKIRDEIKQVALTDSCSVMLTEEGDVYTAGSNSNGKVGNGSKESWVYEPQKIMSDVEQVYASTAFNVMAVTRKGDLYSWGFNDYGQVGNGSKEDQLTPVKILNVNGRGNVEKPVIIDGDCGLSIQQNMSVCTGETVKLLPAIYAENQEDMIKLSTGITFSSSDPSVATVNGTLTMFQDTAPKTYSAAGVEYSLWWAHGIAIVSGHKTGTATITVTLANGLSESCEVIVTDQQEDTSGAGSTGHSIILGENQQGSADSSSGVGKFFPDNWTMKSSVIPAEVKMSFKDDGSYKIKVAIGIGPANILDKDSEWSKYKTTYEDAEKAWNGYYQQKYDLKKVSLIDSPKLSTLKPKVSLMGYLESDYDSHGNLIPNSSKGGVTGNIKMGGDVASWRFITPIGPMYIKLGASGEASVKLEPVWEEDNGEKRLSLGENSNMVLTTSINITGGYGIDKVASLSATGKASMNFQVLPASKGTLDAAASVNARVIFVFDQTWELKKYEKILWDTTGKTDKNTSNDLSEENMKLMNAPGEEDVSEWSGDVTGDAGTHILKEGLLGSSIPMLVQYGDKQVLVWQEYDGTRQTANSSVLTYSVYNNGEWSKPTAVYDDGCGDSYADIKVINDTLALVWQKQTKTITDEEAENPETALSTLAANSEIYYAEFDNSTDTFTNIIRITDNEYCDMMPKFVEGTNDISVAYVRNDDNSFLQTSGNNQIYCSKYDDGSFSEETLVETAQGTIDRYVPYMQGEALRVMYVTQVEDMVVLANNFGEQIDAFNELMCFAEDGTISKLEYEDGMIHVMCNGELYVYNPVNGKVTQYSAGNAAFDSTAAYCSNGNKSAYVWSVYNDEDGIGSVVASMKTDSGYSDPVTLYTFDKEVSRVIAPVLTDDGTWNIAVNQENFATSLHNLVYLQKEESKASQLYTAHINENDTKNGLTAVDYIYANTSDSAIDNVSIVVEAENGQKAEKTENLHLDPGQVVSGTIYLDLTAIDAGQNVSISIYEPTQAENTVKPITEELAVTDISLVGTATEDENGIQISAIATNEGSKDAQTVITLYEDAEMTTKLSTADSVNIEAGKTETVNFTVNPEDVVYNEDGAAYLTLYSEVEGGDINDDNNVTYLALYQGEKVYADTHVKVNDEDEDDSGLVDPPDDSSEQPITPVNPGDDDSSEQPPTPVNPGDDDSSKQQTPTPQGGGNTTTPPIPAPQGDDNLTTQQTTSSDNTTTTQQKDSTGGNTIANVAIGQNLTDTKAKVTVKVISNTLDNPTAAYVRSTDKNAGKKTSLSVPDTVTIEGVKYKIVEVSASAFKNKKKLKKVTIGKNVTTIGDNAFAGCSKLKKIIIKSTVLKSVGKNAIKGINKKASIKVPKKQLKAYKKLFTKKTGYKKTMKVKK